MRLKRCKPLQGFCTLTILLILPWNVLTAPQRIRRDIEWNNKDNESMTNVNDTALQTKVKGNKTESTFEIGDNLKSKEDWTKGISDLFSKWGYKNEEIPEPFGSKASPDLEAPSPEFAKILSEIKDSIPDDIRTPIELIVHSEGIKDSDKVSGSMTKLEEIDQTIREIEASLKAQPAKVSSDPLRAPSHSNETSEDKKKGKKDHKTFCADFTGPCPEDDYEDEQTPLQNASSSTDMQKLNQGKETLDRLIANLTSILGSPKEITVEDSSIAKEDLTQISALVHEIESIAEKLCNNESNKGSNATRVLEANQHSKTPKTVSPSNGTVLISNHPADMDPIKLVSKISLAEKEKTIADDMNHHDLDVDVTVQNELKEVGHQLGQIAEQERERAQSEGHEASLEEKKNIENVFKKIDEKGHKEEVRDKSQPDLHKQVEETIKRVSELHETQSAMKQNSHLGQAWMETKVNAPAELAEKIANPSDESKEKFAFESSSRVDSEPSSSIGQGSEDLKDLLNTEIDEVSEINNAHEKHKAEMLQVIHNLKLTSNKEEDRKRIEKIEDLVKAIDREHHNALELQEKLSKITDSSEEAEVQHLHTEKHAYKPRKHPDDLGKKVESLENIGKNIVAKAGPSAFDTTIEESLHTSKRIKSKESKHHEFEQSLSSTKTKGSDIFKTNVQDVHPSPKEFVDTGKAGNDFEGSRKFSDGNGLQTLDLDELALEPGEVNYNGGIHAKIQDMIDQNPSGNGKWPDTDVWPDEFLENANSDYNNIKGANSEERNSINVSQVAKSDSQQETDSSEPTKEIEIKSSNEGQKFGDNFDNDKVSINENGERSLNSIETIGAVEQAHDSLSLTKKEQPEVIPNSIPDSPSQSGSDVNVINIEHDLETIENSDRVEDLLNILDNGPTEAKFRDFSKASHNQKMGPYDGPLNPERLESIIRKERGLPRSDTSNHHVSEHEISDSVQTFGHGGQQRHQKRSTNLRKLRA